MMSRNCSLMLAFLLESKTQENVQRIFDELTNQLGVEVFQSLFRVILTDNGPEFQNPSAMENTVDGEVRTKLYYCNPHSSWQKGTIEKNHEYIRMVVPLNNQLHQSLSLQEIPPDEVTLIPQLLR